MKIIRPGYKYISHDNLSPQQFIELIGRTCYKSTDRITEDSAVKFVDNLINNKHWAMLEHETIYIETALSIAQSFIEEIYELNLDPAFFHISCYGVTNGIISGSIRSFLDVFSKIDITSGHIYSFWIILKEIYPWAFSKINNNQLDDNFVPKVYFTVEENTTVYARKDFINKYIEPENTIIQKPFDKYILFRHLTHTVKFICDRGVSHELVRHRPCSFAQESTRYCNYSKDKFGNEITVIKPIFYEEGSDLYIEWKSAMRIAESHYFGLLALGSTPQEARDVLPNSLKTEIVVTATEEEWQHIVDLRSKGTTGKPHPQMVEIMQPWHKELIQITEGRIQ